MELMGRRFEEKRKIVKEKLNIVSTSVIDGKVGHGTYDEFLNLIALACPGSDH